MKEGGSECVCVCERERGRESKIPCKPCNRFRICEVARKNLVNHVSLVNLVNLVDHESLVNLMNLVNWQKWAQYMIIIRPGPYNDPSFGFIYWIDFQDLRTLLFLLYL